MMTGSAIYGFSFQFRREKLKNLAATLHWRSVTSVRILFQFYFHKIILSSPHWTIVNVNVNKLVVQWHMNELMLIFRVISFITEACDETENSLSELFKVQISKLTENFCQQM